MIALALSELLIKPFSAFVQRELTLNVLQDPLLLLGVVGAALAAEAMVFLLEGDVQEALVAQREAVVDRPSGGVAVALEVLASGDGDRAAMIGALQDEIYDPGDGVGAILRRRPVGQDLGVVDGAHRNQAEVGGRRALEGARVDVQVARRVAALAVHQHQGVVGVEAAQSG